MDPDLELLENWRAGDAAAGEALFARYFGSLCGFFATKVGADADDLVQRSLFACVRAKDQFQGKSTFRTYLFTVARNELYQFLRTRAREEDRLDFSITSVAQIITTPGTRLARDADRRRVVEVLRTMPVEQQTLLELHYWEDFDMAALAEVFDTTSGAIRVRLHRARHTLREKLARDETAELTRVRDLS